jgi:hypothetical protein
MQHQTITVLSDCMYFHYLGQDTSYPVLFSSRFSQSLVANVRLIHHTALDLLPLSDSFCHSWSYSASILDHHPGCGCFLVSNTLHSS